MPKTIKIKAPTIGTGQSTVPTDRAVRRQIQREDLDRSVYSLNADMYQNLARGAQLTETKFALNEGKAAVLEALPPIADYSGEERSAEVKRRQKWSDDLQKQMDYIDAALSDNQRQRHFGTLRSAYYAFRHGIEVTRTPLRMIFQGEEMAGAYKYASELVSYHEPTGVLDNFIYQGMSNAMPMGTILAATFATGGVASGLGASAATSSLLGNAVSFAMIGTQEGSNFYLDLRNQGVSKETATAAAVLGGLGIGALEVWTGKLLGATFGRIPGVGKAIGETDRVARFNALRKLSGKPGDLFGLYANTSGKKFIAKETNDAMMGIFGGAATKIGAMLDMGRQVGTGGVTGGFEELFQGLLQMGLGELATQHDGVESYLPRTKDGKIDGRAVEKQLWDSFVIGAMLEGAFGAAATVRSAGSRMQSAEFMETVKNNLRGKGQRLVIDETGKQVNREVYADAAKLDEENARANLNLDPDDQLPTDNFRRLVNSKGLSLVNTAMFDEAQLDFIARWTLMQSMVEESKAAKGDKRLTSKQRAAIVDKATQAAIQKLVQDPLGAALISYGNAKVETVDKEHLVFEIGGRKVNIIKTAENIQGNNAMYSRGVDGSVRLLVSESVWNKVKDPAISHEDFVFINNNLGSTFPHEAVHSIVEHLPDNQRIAVYELFGYEANPAEGPSLHAELSEAAHATQPYSEAFRDALARIEVAVRGNKAGEWAKQREFLRRGKKAVTTGSPVSFKFVSKPGAKQPSEPQSSSDNYFQGRNGPVGWIRPDGSFIKTPKMLLHYHRDIAYKEATGREYFGGALPQKYYDWTKKAVRVASYDWETSFQLSSVPSESILAQIGDLVKQVIATNITVVDTSQTEGVRGSQSPMLQIDLTRTDRQSAINQIKAFARKVGKHKPTRRSLMDDILYQGRQFPGNPISDLNTKTRNWLLDFISKNKNEDPKLVKAAFSKIMRKLNQYGTVKRKQLELTAEEAELLNRHPELVTRMKELSHAYRKKVQGLIQRNKRKNKFADQAVRDHINKTLHSLADKQRAGKAWTEWTTEDQAQVDKIIADYAAKVQTPKIAVLSDSNVQNVQALFASEPFVKLFGEIREVFDRHNAEMRIQGTEANQTIGGQILDKPATRGYETERQTEHLSLVQETQPVAGAKVGIKGIGTRAGRKISRDLGAYIPPNTKVYGEVMGLLSDFFGTSMVFFDSGQWQYTAAGEIIIDQDKGNRELNKFMSDIFGPAWPLLLELYNNVVSNDLEALDPGLIKGIGETIILAKGAFSQLQTTDKGYIKHSKAPLEARMAGAFVNVRPLSEKAVRIEDVADTGVPADLQVQLTGEDLIRFFVDMGLPPDDTQVDFDVLGSENVQPDVEVPAEQLRKQVESATKSEKTKDQEGVVSEEGTLDIPSQFNVAMNMNLTAQNAARQAIKLYLELSVPQATTAETDLVRTSKGKMITGPKAGQFSSPRAVMRNVMRQNYGSKFEAFKTANNYAQLVDVLLRTLDQFKGIEEHLTGTDELDLAIQNTFAAEPDAVVRSLAAVQAEYAKLTGEGNTLTEQLQKLKDLANLTESYKFTSEKPNAFEAALKDYISNDPTGAAINQQISMLREVVRNTTGQLFQSRIDPLAGPTVSAQTMTDLKDALNSLADMRTLRLQIDIMKLQNDWNTIFGITEVAKLRDILKMMWQTVTNKKSQGGNKPYDADQLSQDYALAARFAIEAMNFAGDSKAELDNFQTAVEATINRLSGTSDPSVDDQYRLQEYQHYLAAIELARDILSQQGDYGAKIYQFITTTYQKTADAWWDDLNLDSVATGEKLRFYTPRMFTHDGTVSDTAADQFTFHQLAGRMIGRKIESLSHHLNNGEVFTHRNLISAFMAGNQQVVRSIASHEFINHNIETKQFLLEPKAGYLPLEAPGSMYTTWTIIEQATGQPLHEGIKEFKTARDTVESLQQSGAPTGYSIEPVTSIVYAPAKMAEYINAVTRRSGLRDTKFGSSLMATNAKLKLLKVAWGMFHRRAFVWSAMVAGPAPIGYEWRSKDHSLWEKLKKRFDYIGTRQFGRELMENYDYEIFKTAFYGTTFFRRQDIGRENINYKTVFDKWLALQPKNAVTKASRETLDRLAWWTNQLQTELFGIFGSTLKTAVAVNEARRLLAKHADKIAAEKAKSAKAGKFAKHFENYLKTFPNRVENKSMPDDFYSKTEEDILRAVAGMVNADFGGLNLRRMGISEGKFDAARLLFLGPDWTLSNFQTVSKLIKSKKGGVTGSDAFRSGSDIEREIYLHFWTRIASRVTVLVTAINLLMAGLDDDTFWQRLKFAKKSKKFKILMADVTPVVAPFAKPGERHYFNAAGSFMDPLKWVFEPIQSAVHKSSAIAKPVIRLVSGQDYRHRRPTDVWDIPEKGLYSYKEYAGGPVKSKEAPAFIIQEVLNVAPIQTQKLFQLHEGGKSWISDLLEAGFGLDMTQTYSREQ